jgi:hypothetical protein
MGITLTIPILSTIHLWYKVIHICRLSICLIDEILTEGPAGYDNRYCE